MMVTRKTQFIGFGFDRENRCIILPLSFRRKMKIP